MHLLCVVEDSLPARHVANIATDVARRTDARLTVGSAARGRQKDAASSLRDDLLVIGPPRPWSLPELLPWSPRNRLINRSRTPVMVVSDNAAVQRYDRIVLAYDLPDAGREAAARGATRVAAQRRDPCRVPARPKAPPRLSEVAHRAARQP